MSSMVAHLCHAVLLFFIRHLPSGDVGFQTLVKVDHAGNRVGNGKDNEDDCDNRYMKSAFEPHVQSTISFYVTYQRSSNFSLQACSPF